MMQRDIRSTATFKEAESLCKMARRPGTGQITDAAELSISADDHYVAFAGTLTDALEGIPPTRICVTNLTSADTRILTFGPSVDRSPKFSPVGRQIAFLSDRNQGGAFQLFLLDPGSGAARSAPAVDGWVEYLHWSPDGKRILLGVAGHGADVSAGEGAVTSRQVSKEITSWMPEVEEGDEHYRWRSIWVYHVADERMNRISTPGVNIWEAAWCGNHCVAAIVSEGPGEGLWYRARVRILEIATGIGRDLYVPVDQLASPSASSSGKSLAVIEGISSDRGVLAGELKLIDVKSGTSAPVDTHGIDVTHAEWLSDRELLLAGHREFETAVAVIETPSLRFTELWRSTEISTGGYFAKVCALRRSRGCAFVAEGFTCPPEIAVVQGGAYRPVKSFGSHDTEHTRALAAIEQVSWRAPDDLEIQGWLLRPEAKAPHPLIMYVHGGPVWHWRPMWIGRGALYAMLLKRGYAVFLPNPRGSTGRGQEFARRVVGDMGGADTYDYLSGLDHLVEQGIADPKRLGVIGGSYGGYMAAWLITQDGRFAAAVSHVPITNFVTCHLISNLPHFFALFLADHYSNAGGKYYQRSPIMHAHKARTPTLNICGALDRGAPAEEAVQFHNALLENGVRSALVVYPEEGHGVRRFPAFIDSIARIIGWFEEHI